METQDNQGVRYHRVPANWADDRRILALSRVALQLYWLVRTGPQMTALTGLCRLGPGAIMDTLGCTQADAHAALEELAQAQLVEADRDARLVYVPGAVTESPPPNHTAIKSVMREFDTMPDCEVRRKYFRELLRVLEQTGPHQKAKQEQLELLRKRSPNGSGNCSGNCSPNGSGNCSGNCSGNSNPNSRGTLILSELNLTDPSIGEGTPNGVPPKSDSDADLASELAKIPMPYETGGSHDQAK